MMAVRQLYSRLSASVHFDIAQQFTPVNTGLSLSMLGTGVPLVLGPYSGFWAPDAFGEPERTTMLSRFKRVLRDRLAAFQQRTARALVITCPAAIDRIVAEDIRAGRVHIISHAIHARDYPPRAAVPEKPSILFLANLEYWKGIFTLLEAFELVGAQVPDSSLEIWGDGGQVARVKELIERSPLRERIHLRGRAPRDKVSEIMRGHSVLLHAVVRRTVRHEHARGDGLRRAGSDNECRCPAYVVHEAGGRVVPMRDAQRLAGALVEILSDRALQKSMGTYNRHRVEAEFDWSRSLDRMESVYQWVLRDESDPAVQPASDTRWTPV